MKCTGLTPVKLRILTGRFLPFFCRLSQEFRPAGNGRSGPVEKLRPAGPVRSEKIGPVPSLARGHLPSPIQKRTFARRRVARLYHLLAKYLCIVSQIQQTFI
jgi:hypothetical protein